MIATVHRYHATIPDGSANLYREIRQVSLCRQVEAKRQVPLALPGANKEHLSVRCAYSTLTKHMRDPLSNRALAGGLTATLNLPCFIAWIGSLTSRAPSQTSPLVEVRA